MAMPDRDTTYNADGSRRDIYRTESNSSAGWVIGGIIVVALIIIAYFVFAGRPTAPADVNVNSTPAITAPAPATPAPSANTMAPSTNTTPMTSAPATPAPATAAPATPAPAATTPSTPAPSGSTPATPAAPAAGQ